MRRTLIDRLPISLPPELEELTRGAAIYDSSCSPEARVWFIDKDGGYYLKASEKDSLRCEALMTEYFHRKGLGAGVIYYGSGKRDLLVTERVPGEDCTHPDLLSKPLWLCDTLATALRELHETDASDCPITDRTESYLATARKNYRAGRHDLSFFGKGSHSPSPREIYRIVEEGGGLLKNEVLLHGDFCLPNIMIDRGRISGYIDLGGAGIGDRHVDVFWGVWTLAYNLKTEEYADRFLDCYGRDKIIPEKLKIVSAAEVFG